MAKKSKIRRERGTGSIFWNESRAVWVARVPYGRASNGRTLYRSVTRKSQAECIAAMRQLSPPSADTTLRDWCERWYCGLTCRSSTQADYRATLDNYVLPTLGHVVVSRLTAQQIDAAISRWRTRLNPNTLAKNVGQLRACLEVARRVGLILSNPVRGCRALKPQKVHTQTFSSAELAAIAASPEAGPTSLMAAVGCRIGEALALDVADFDPAAGTVRISKTFSRAHGIRSPKTANGHRTIRVPAAALPALEAAVSRRTRGPVYLATDGRRLGLATARLRFKSLCKRLGIAYRRPHALRHSVATMLVSAGVPLGDVARYLGDSVGTVVKVYLHAAGTDPADTMDRKLMDDG